jgi:hypothetical protein
MNKLGYATGFALLLAATSARAWFIFIPGSLTRAVTDAVTGAKGNVCVRDSAKVGDVLTSTSGNTGTIQSLSGTSSMCRNPAMPIRAEIEFVFSFSSKAGFNLPDEFEAKTITDLQRFNGALLVATSKLQANKGVVVNARKKLATSDPTSIANAVEKAQVAGLVDAKSLNPEQLQINGARAWRFEVEGTTKGMFGQKLTYLVTVLEGDSEILIVNAFIPTADYDANKAELKKLAESVEGLKLVPLVESSPARDVAPKESASPKAAQDQ